MKFNFTKTEVYASFIHGEVKSLSEQQDCQEIEKFFNAQIDIKEESDTYELSITLDCLQQPHLYSRTLTAKNSVFADIPIETEIDGILSRRQFNPFWSEPDFEKDLSKAPDNIQNMLISFKDDGYASILPVCGEDFSCVSGNSEDQETLRLYINKMYDGAKSVKGSFAVISYADDPFEAVRKSYEYACSKGLIKTALRTEKRLDELYKGFGWCTWNTCYRQVSEKLIFEKLDEFKEKKVPIKWVMIDDGWMQTTGEPDMKLKSFKEDKNKFPDGLKVCVEKIKRNYGIEKVGVWHAISGYWFGVEKDSELYNQEKDNLFETNSGLFIPDGEKAYNFFAHWYSYLKDQGIDFVKIDGQGNSLEFLYGSKNCIQKCCELQQSVDKAVNDFFGGNVINCMAMNNVNTNNRPYTSLSRNSDDFLPENPKSFKSHIMQNIYNAVFHSNLFFCDFDMWQTNDITAKQSSVLRAISGGPVYFSDDIGKTDTRFIKPLMDQNGEVIMCDNIALPCCEHLFDKPENGILKVFNKKGDSYVLAVFNLSDKERSVKLQQNIFGDGYTARGYCSKKIFLEDINITLSANDAEIFTFYPSAENKNDDFTKYIN